MASSSPAGDGKSYGSCCRDLNEVLGAEDFDPLLYVGEDGVLYMSVGVVEMESDEESGFLDHPIYCCPFCGTRLQTAEEVEAKAEQE
jgi:hypothetical protein